MTSKSTWGAIVASALPLVAASCAGAPPPPPAELPPPPPAASEDPPPPPPPPVPLLGPHVDVLPGQAETEMKATFATRRVPFGKGEFVHASLWQWWETRPSCPLMQSGTGCGYFSVAGSAPAPLVHGWVAFAGGASSVYALRKGGEVIDQIDAQGKSTPFLEDAATRSWDGLWMLERAERSVVLGRTGNSQLHLGEISGSPRKLSPLVELPMAMVPNTKAKGARMVEDHDRKPVYGDPVLLSLQDEASKDAWALVWVEALAPPYAWPQGKAYNRDTAQKTPQQGGKKRGSKNGCGGPPSRQLRDKSIDKRLHITRFAGTQQQDDRVVMRSNDLDLQATPLAARATAEGVEVWGVTYGKDGKQVASRKADAPAKVEPTFENIKLSSFEQINAVGFDPVSGEGVLHLQQGDKFSARRFDAEGNLKGEPIKLPEQERYLSLLGWVGDRWAGLYGLSLRPFASDAPAVELATDDRQLLAFVSREDGKAMLLVKSNKAIETIDPGAPKKTPVPVLDAGDDFRTYWMAAASIPGSAPLVVAYKQGDGGGELLWARVEPGAKWATLPDAIPADLGSVHEITFHRVWGDVVAHIAAEYGQRLVWVKAQKSIALPKEPRLRSLDSETEVGGLRGPLLDGGALLIPVSPGPPVEVTSFKGIFRDCYTAIPTGPETLVLPCTRGVDPMKPGVKASLRVYGKKTPG